MKKVKEVHTKGEKGESSPEERKGIQMKIILVITNAKRKNKYIALTDILVNIELNKKNKRSIYL